MSAFLGPIHTWLYGKILFQNELVERISEYAQDKGWIENDSAARRCGTLPKGELAEICDESNIHGWLQDKVSLVEGNLAYLVTELLKEHPERLNEICNVAYEVGKTRKPEENLNLGQAYKHIESLILNGMPCDRVNDLIKDTSDSIEWRETSDVHKKYWDEAGGDNQNFFAVREKAVQGIFDGTGIVYETIGDYTYELKRLA